MSGLQLHIEGFEDRGRQNNLWLRSLPEPQGKEHLETTVTTVFRDP